jgi:hypothetical protein
MAKTTVVSVGVSVRHARPRRSYFVALTVAAGFALPILPSPASAYDSSSGRRVPGFGAVSAPVDRLGPTLRPDPLITPDSGWMGSGTAGAIGLGRAGLTPLVPAPPQPPPAVIPTVSTAGPGKGTAKTSHKPHGRIILQKPNG